MDYECVSVCVDVSVCEALKLSSGVSVSATAFGSVIPAVSAGGTAAGEMRLSVGNFSLGVCLGQGLWPHQGMCFGKLL